MLEFVDLETARARDGVRIVVAGSVPSPWSEATKGLFRLAGIPLVAVRRSRDTQAIDAWTGTDNVPVVLVGKEPPRSSWSAVVGLVARLAPGVLVPEEPQARAKLMGAIDLVAGEGGLGWNVRLTMIDAGLRTRGERGFPANIAAYLAARYGYVAEQQASVRNRIVEQLAFLRSLLGERAYFGGTVPDALDIYVATFLTIISTIPADASPLFSPSIHKAFACGADELGPLIPSELVALRARMFEHHLPWPFEL
jgi:glutathione S-transferase